MLFVFTSTRAALTPLYLLSSHTSINFGTYLGLCGNYTLSNSVSDALLAGQHIDNIISSVRSQTQNFEYSLVNQIRPQLVELANIFDRPDSNGTDTSNLLKLLRMVEGNISFAESAVADIRKPLMQVTIAPFLSVREIGFF